VNESNAFNRENSCADIEPPASAVRYRLTGSPESFLLFF
jgi:hypothetical protein